MVLPVKIEKLEIDFFQLQNVKLYNKCVFVLL
jgi:hypothetical protein